MFFLSGSVISTRKAELSIQVIVCHVMSRNTCLGFLPLPQVHTDLAPFTATDHGGPKLYALPREIHSLEKDTVLM